MFIDEEQNRIAFQVLDNGAEVSTVYFSSMYESAVFPNSTSDKMLDNDRYASRVSALRGHLALVEKWKNREIFWQAEVDTNGDTAPQLLVCQTEQAGLDWLAKYGLSLYDCGALPVGAPTPTLDQMVDFAKRFGWTVSLEVCTPG